LLVDAGYAAVGWTWDATASECTAVIDVRPCTDQTARVTLPTGAFDVPFRSR
jgi:hypothetical protein